MKFIKILVIEDETDDEYLIKHAFKKASIINEIEVIRDGEEAINYLFRKGEFENRDYSLPDLIILDLKLPKVSGKKILTKISEDSELKNIPVIILSNSKDTEDILDCYDRGVYAYLTKPLTSSNIIDFIINESFFGIYLVKKEQTETD